MSKRLCALIIAAMILAIALAGCQGAQPEAETAQAGASHTPAAQETPQPQETQGIPMAEFPVEGYSWRLAAPASWEGQVTFAHMTSENPNVEDLYAIRYTPPEGNLPQDVNVGFLFVIPTDRWGGGESATEQDVYMVRIGTAGTYTIAYSGTRDNPLSETTEAGLRFAGIMLLSKDAPEVLRIVE